MQKKLLKLVFITLAILSVQTVNAQRYLTEIFANTTVISDFPFGENYSVLTGTPILQDLLMDVYEPEGDTASRRPVIILNHAGSFLPRYINQLAVGSKEDSSTVEIAKRFARMGYVVGVPAYRTGWNPQGTQDERTETYVQAIYRGVQDAKTCVRWFRGHEALGGNTLRIDTDLIAVGGQGSGGYISLACSALNKFAELKLTKLFNFTTNAFMIDTDVLGDWNGLGGNPALNNNNHSAFSSRINMVFNIGGAIIDSSWIEAGEVPIISMHGVQDAFDPYAYDIFNIPGTTLFVLDVSGSSDVIRITNELGNNDLFFTPPINDEFTSRANAVNTQLDGTYNNGGNEGLFGFTGAANGNTPWEFWDDAGVVAGATSLGQDPATILANSYASNPVYQALGPVAGKTRALTYIDTIVGYVAPRLFREFFEQAVSIEETENNIGAQLSLYPNPASSAEVYISGLKGDAQVHIYDAQGKRIAAQQMQFVTDTHALDVGDLKQGLYFIQVLRNGDLVGSLRLMKLE